MIRTLVLSLVAVGLAGTSPAFAQAGAAPDSTKGAAVYAAQKCSMCHALDGKGMARDRSTASAAS